jgi:hypothetical protein
MKIKIVFFTIIVFSLFNESSKAQINLIELPDLEEIVAYEVTGQVNFFNFNISDKRLKERLGSLLVNNNDFGGVPGEENYDIYFSDSLGNLSTNGQFITIECWYVGTSGGGGCNIADLELKFKNGDRISSNKLTSFFFNGNNYISKSELSAVDCNKNTWSTLGNLSQNNTNFLRLTFSFSHLITSTNFTICSGDDFEYRVGPYIFNEINSNGSVIKKSQSGCNDSIEMVNIDVSPLINKTLNLVKCKKENFNLTISNITFNIDNPVGQVIVNSILGCDTLYDINIRFIDTIIEEINYLGCKGDNFSVLKGQSKFDETNTSGTEFVLNSEFCDTLYIVNFVFRELNQQKFNYSGCKGDGFELIINNTKFNEINPKGTVISSAQFGCDTIYDINLIFNEVPEKSTTINRCLGDGFSLFTDGLAFNEKNPSGQFIIPSKEGCDTLNNLTILFTDCEQCKTYAPNIISLSSNINNVFSIFLDKDCIFTDNELSIYDRWGNNVYKSNIAVWDGYFNGEMCEMGVYTYLFKYRIFETSFIVHGTLTVLK